MKEVAEDRDLNHLQDLLQTVGTVSEQGGERQESEPSFQTILALRRRLPGKTPDDLCARVLCRSVGGLLRW